MVTSVPRKLFTVDDYYRMAEAGILREDDRVELIEGEIIQMGPMSSKHARCTLFLNSIINKLVQSKAIVGSQLPLRLSNIAEPEPDILVLLPDKDHYAKAHATAVDVLLIIEVCFSSINYDMNVKVPMYAKSGVQEVWIVDLENAIVHQFSNPINETYSEHVEFKKNETIQAKQIEEIQLNINDILGLGN